MKQPLVTRLLRSVVHAECVNGLQEAGWLGAYYIAESMGIDGLVKMMIRRGIERYCNVVFILHFSWHNGSLKFNGFEVLQREDYFFDKRIRYLGSFFSFSLANNFNSCMQNVTCAKNTKNEMKNLK